MRRVIAKHLGDGHLDFMIRNRLRAVVGQAVERRLGRKPITASLFVEIGRPLGQLAQRFPEDRKLVARLGTGETKAQPSQARVRPPDQRRRTQEYGASGTGRGT